MSIRSSGTASRAIFAAWFVGVSIPLIPLSLQHVVPLARQPRPVSSHGAIAVRHVLSTDCRCSHAVVESLLRRTAMQERREEVWLLGNEAGLTTRLGAAGYQIRRVTAADVGRELGASGTPFLFIHAADGRELYAGGYAPRRPRGADDVHDLRIVAAVTSGQAVQPYPVYGCLGGDSLG